VHFFEAAALSPEYADRARSYALAAARQAEERAAWAEAARLYEQGIGGEESEPRLLAAYARALDFAAPFSLASQQTFSRAIDGFRERSDHEGMAAALLAGARTGSDPIADISLLREVLESPARVDDRTALLLRYRLHNVLGTWSPTALDDIRRLRQELQGLAGRPGVPEAPAISKTLKASRALALGTPADASRLMRAAASDFSALGRTGEAIDCFNTAASMALAAGSIDLASECSRAYWRAAQAAGHATGQHNSTRFLEAALLARWATSELEGFLKTVSTR
jgi:hypothetical protein